VGNLRVLEVEFLLKVEAMQDDMAVFVKWCHVSSLVHVTIKNSVCYKRRGRETRRAGKLWRRWIMLISAGWLPTLHLSVAGLPTL